jgi:hypothetical protein
MTEGRPPYREEAPSRVAGRRPDGPEPVESSRVQEIGLSEPQRVALSASLGVVLGTLLAELARRARRARRA